MRAGRVIALVFGCVLVVVGFASLLGDGALGAAYVFGRDDDGYLSVSPDRMETATVAISAGDEAFSAEPASPSWLLDVLDADVRLGVTGRPGGDVFVGIGPADEVRGYLAGVAHDEVVEIDGRRPVLRLRPGDDEVTPPTAETFWVASVRGAGPQQLDWEARRGDWAVVVMNTDGSPGLVADVDVGVRAGFLAPLAWLLAGLGLVAIAGGVVVIVVGASGSGAPAALPPPGTTLGPGPVGVEVSTTPDTPVRLSAALDPGLSRWMWLVKWFLAIPHLVVLIVLWVAFGVLTFVAGVVILVTGRYPSGIFRFNVGVLRWTWRVSFYATTGGLGTDRYPPFGLDAESDDPATLDIAEPGRLSRGLVLVKWWLLAIPHRAEWPFRSARSGCTVVHAGRSR